MSSIKLTADSNGGTFELKAPASSSNTRVLTLPDTANLTLHGGRILQVVQSVKTDKFSTSSFTSWTDIPITPSITATKTNHKIMVDVMLNVSTNNGRHIAFRLEKDGTRLDAASGDAAGSNRQRGCFHLYNEDQNGQYMVPNFYLKFLDTAADTNSHTYNIAAIDWGGQGSTDLVINSTANDSDSAANARVISTITLTEIAE